MASLRRNKTLSPDGQTARFLYTIIKQLDLKAIDWNLVAGSLEITNGHAARMRYSRFKQHMEGAITTQTRAPKVGKKEKESNEGKDWKQGKGGKEGKEGKVSLKKGKKRAFEEEADHKKGAPAYAKTGNESSGAGPVVKGEYSDVRIKNEPNTERAPIAVQIKTENPLLQQERPSPYDAHPAVRVKREPGPDATLSTIDPDIWHILPQARGTNISLDDQPLRTTATALSTTAQPQQLALRPLYQFAPAQSTVSLAELEVSPRSRAPTTTTADSGRSPASFTDGGLWEGARKALPDSAVASSGSEIRIKDEPMLDADDWMVLGNEVVVKNEPVEM
jgi:hypothetical protein